MLKNLGNLASMMKQAQEMGGRLQELNAELKNRRTTGAAGGGMVEIEINGLMEVNRCTIDPQLVAQQDRELLEDLIASAMNQAVLKARQLHAEAVQSVTGGLQIPGLEEALGKLTGGNDSTS